MSNLGTAFDSAKPQPAIVATQKQVREQTNEQVDQAQTDAEFVAAILG